MLGEEGSQGGGPGGVRERSWNLYTTHSYPPLPSYPPHLQTVMGGRRQFGCITSNSLGRGDKNSCAWDEARAQLSRPLLALVCKWHPRQDTAHLNLLFSLTPSVHFTVGHSGAVVKDFDIKVKLKFLACGNFCTMRFLLRYLLYTVS